MPDPRKSSAVAVSPEEFARSLGGTVGKADGELETSVPSPPGPDSPEAFAQKLGGQVGTGEPAFTQPAPTGLDATKPANLVSNDFLSQAGRTAYAAIPQVTGALGAVAGGTIMAPAGPFGVGAGGVLGAAFGGEVGRGVQWLIDEIVGRPEALRNPAGPGETGLEQMTLEASGQIVGRAVGAFRGAATPLSREAAERAATNEKFNLGMSTPEITGGPSVGLQTTLGARGFAGRAVQQQMRDKTTQTVEDVLRTVVLPGQVGTQLETGTAVKDALARDVGRTSRRLEGSISQLAPETGTAATGRTVASGVRAGREAFAQQGAKLQELIADGPDIDIRPVKAEALRVFNDEIMPYLLTVPADAPRTGGFKRLMELYKAGKLIDPSAETMKALQEAALDKANNAPLKLINKILTARDLQSFKEAVALNSGLREAGKGTDLIAADKAQALSSLFQKQLRGLMGEAYPAWDAASTAYGPNAQLFQSKFIQNVIDKDPEAVLASVTGANADKASNARRLHQALVSLPAQFGSAEEQAAGQRAWNTIRAEWLRRDIVQDDPFGIMKRIRATDPDTLRAWFPDVPGKDVLKRTIAAGRRYESQLLADIAEADPAKVVELIGRSPSRVEEARTLLTRAPMNPQIWQNVQRTWINDNIVAGDPRQLTQRLDRLSQDTLNAWMPTPADKQALATARQLGRALDAQPRIPNRGTFEGVEAVTVAGAVVSGNIQRALTLAMGFEGVPWLISKAMYNPTIQKYVLDATGPTLPVTTRTAAILRIGQAYADEKQAERAAAVQRLQQQRMQAAPTGAATVQP